MIHTVLILYIIDKGYQYNVLIDGVVFQIVSPPEYLESNSPSISNENKGDL